MAEFNGKQGRWVTTKDGRKVFISDDVKSYSDIKKTGKEVAHFQNDMYGRIGTVYDLGNKKYALLDDQNEKVVEVRDGTDDGWVHRYIRDVRMHKINHSDKTAVNYSKEYDPNSKKTEDLVDKQEREIAEAKKRIDAYNSDKVKSDPVKSNALYKGLSEEAEKILSMKDSDFESMSDKYTEMYGILAKFANANITSGDTYERLLKENHRLEAVLNFAYVNTGRYQDEVNKYSDKKARDRK